MPSRVLARIVVIGVLSMGMLAPVVSTAQVTTTYTYDAQGQVRTVSRPAQTVTYVYDAAANRTQMTSTAPLAGRATAQSSALTANAPDVERVVPPPPPIPTTPPPPPFPPPPPPPISPLPAAAPSSSR